MWLKFHNGGPTKNENEITTCENKLYSEGL